MDNKGIINILKLTASLLELYGENPFKVRSYQTAVYNLERTEQNLSQLDEKKLSQLSGVGKSIASTIQEINHTGESSALKNLVQQTPVGILELSKIKGLGSGKIKTVWDQLGVETPEDLLSAAEQGALANLLGFGEKTQAKVLQIMKFHLSNKGLIHYKQAHLLGLSFEKQLLSQFPEVQITRTGAFRRKSEVIRSLQYIWATHNIEYAVDYLDNLEALRKNLQLSGPLRWIGAYSSENVLMDVRFCKNEEYGTKSIYYTGSIDHLLLTNNQGKSLKEVLVHAHSDESAIYDVMGWPVIIPELREGRYEKDFLQDKKMDGIIALDDIEGILHNHSTYSDGKHSLEDMARACKELGYGYLGISDHSQTAVYANGLDEDKVLEQHHEIDKLNQELAPFRVFKGIESDILNDGSLDYPDSVLHTFDFVVASVHSNLGMDIEKATKRLFKAIQNPYTTILGHPTSRLLLKREGYPIDHKKIIDACAQFKVVIEINAHPWRLDLDWRWIHYAVEKGVKISINPDAHEKAGLEDVYYGICVARKAGLVRNMTFNAMSMQEMEDYLGSRKNKIAISSGT